MIDKPVMIITGTRKGIGKNLAEYYAQKGYQVIGCSRSDFDYKLDNYQHYCLDVCDESLLKKRKRGKKGGLDDVQDFFKNEVIEEVPRDDPGLRKDLGYDS